MKKMVLAVGLVFPVVVAAQPVTLQLTEQQVGGIRQAIAQCEARVPLSCARLLIYLDDLVETASKPKPAEKPVDPPQ